MPFLQPNQYRQSTEGSFQIKYTEAILSNSTRELLWFEITEILTAVFTKNNCIMLFMIISAHFRSLCDDTVFPATRQR